MTVRFLIISHNADNMTRAAAGCSRSWKASGCSQSIYGWKQGTTTIEAGLIAVRDRDSQIRHEGEQRG